MNRYGEREEPGRAERAQVRVMASEGLKEQLLGFVRPNLREELGREALFLYSNASWRVYRRTTGGSLMPNDARAERSFRRAEDANSSQMRLYQTVRTKEIVQRGGRELLGISLIARVGRRAVEILQNDEHIPNDLLYDDGMPVHLAWPDETAVAPRYREGAEAKLRGFILGSIRPDNGSSYNKTSRNTEAYVTDMKLRYRPEFFGRR